MDRRRFFGWLAAVLPIGGLFGLRSVRGASLSNRVDLKNVQVAPVMLNRNDIEHILRMLYRHPDVERITFVNERQTQEATWNNDDVQPALIVETESWPANPEVQRPVGFHCPMRLVSPSGLVY